MEELILGFIFTFLVVISFETIFTRILGNGVKHPAKKILVLAIQCFVITWLLYQMYT
ncbi:hypothetical protein ACFFJJ_19305 [Fictibacillus phosphorivorans]|jgi:uncharacterized membrane protein (DUF485 family)|uniref:hypothetical protein n=1 Tax=Fictibacillus sp. 26RED30 TaxID=2745877 RepID=UPI0018CDA9E8|nr:hypothetical protein [Fictibacillus sp. 26RED30]MBH0162396.1 hypothetical protein [Fictibacillus sp. 26RED30]